MCITEFIAWLLQIGVWFAYVTCWSFLIALPGLFAFHFEAIIKGIGESMRSRKNMAEMENKILLCRKLQFSLRLISEQIRYPILFAILNAEFPLVTEVYWGFQLIKAEAPFEDYLYYFVDSMVIVA